MIIINFYGSANEIADVYWVYKTRLADNNDGFAPGAMWVSLCY